MHKALFFGSFNPIHLGHIQIAEYVVENKIADEVVFMVSPQSPFKQNLEMLDDDIRFELVSLAIQDNKQLFASNIEFFLPKPSYTAKTLEVLRKNNPEINYSVLLGSDQVELFHKWNKYKTILSNHKIFLYPRRPGMENSDLIPYPGMTLLDAPMYDISSTDIRRAIEHDLLVPDLLPEKVYQRIVEMKYYCK